jgi:hypothetical protein
VVLAVNGEVEIFQRSGATGTVLTTPAPTATSLNAFFGTTGAFDPRVIYDPLNHKIIVTAADQGTNTSDIWIAVASTDTPGVAPVFSIQHFNTALTVGGNLSWADFPQVGLDNAGNLYLTANMFSFSGGQFGGTRMWVVNDGSVTTNGLITPAAIDPSSIAGTGELFSLAPANMVEPIAAAAPSGEYLVSYNSAKNAAGHNVLDVLHVDSQGHSALTVVDLGSQIDQLGLYGGVTAPQPGTFQTLDADDSRTASAVYATVNGHGYLYVAADIIPRSGPDAGHTTAHWWVLSVDPTTGAVGTTPVNQGDISGNTFVSGSNLRSFYPSLAVDANGDLAVSFSGSGPTNGTGYTGYASAYEVTIANAATTSTHEVGAWSLVEAGVASYYRTFGGADNRWGDYSSISTDPLNAGHFWAFNEYAQAHGYVQGSQNGVWGTELGYF